MNRYRIYETVPKNKAKGGKGSRIVDRIVRTLKKANGREITVRVKPLPMRSPLQALTHTTVLPKDLPNKGMFYEITWKDAKPRKQPWQALAERSQGNE